MSTPLRALLVEDNPDDAELILLQLRRGGYETHHCRVETAADMREALAQAAWDVIIADYAMPRFSGLAALRLARELVPDIPLILVSGTVGEDLAVQAMKAGATDYIMKDNMTRLVPAVERELRDAEHRCERRRAEEALYHERERAMVTLNSIGDGVITTDVERRVEYLNPIAEQLTGWGLADARGRPLMDVFQVFNEHTRKPVQNPAEICLLTGCVVSLDEQSLLVNRNGQEFPVEDSAAPIRDRDGNILGAVLVFHDVSRERHMAHQISWQETHDALTGLVNRREFEARLQALLEAPDREAHQHVVLYLDLDQFKVINDTCGHVAGDALLKQLTELLLEQLPAGTTLSRLGGDEFGALLNDHDTEGGRRVAELLLDVIRGFRFTWEDRSYEILASVGMVPVTRTMATASAVLSAADVACYVAKDTGRNRVHVYQEGDAEQARRHSEMQWVGRINRALEEDRFVLFRQRIQPLGASDETLHHELLVRLRSRNGELVAPGAFIPAAERYNLMPALDRWVIRKAFAYCTSMAADRGRYASMLFAINLSGNSLADEGMLDFIQDELERQSVDPSLLCFEITETAAITNLARAAEFMRTLRRLGCRFALDDFGSGLSSFAYLKSLPVDFLKIDGYFVKDMVNDAIDHSIVEAINQIGHVMGMQTIAEFVENDAIIASLRALGVDYAQGYGVGRPEPIEDTDRAPASRAAD